jgi:hypothetical protein
MSIIDNQAQGNIRDFDRRLRALEYASNMNSAAIGRGGIRVHSGGMITIENGGLRVTGTAEIIGRLIASGLVTFIGDVVISGPLDVSGTVDVSGVMTVLNDLEIASGGLFKAGDIELRPDGSAKFGSMEIDPSGKITSGSATINPDGSAEFGNMSIDTTGVVKVGSAMTLDPTESSGALVFSNGARVFTDATTIQVFKGTSAVTVADGTATLQGTGSDYIRVDDAGIRANGPLRATSTLKVDVMNTAPAGKTANVYWDPADHVFKFIP